MGNGLVGWTIDGIARAWLALVAYFAARAADDQGREAEGLEPPPRFPGADGNPQWQAAQLAYRQRVRDLEAQAEREEERRGRPWWALLHILYSVEMFWTIVATVIAVWILRWLGEL